MKIVQINSVPNGSTGKIMMNIHDNLLQNGYESYVVWGRGRRAKNEHEIYMDGKIGVYFHVLYARITGKNGFASKRATKKLIHHLEKINPDIIHLHNIHGYYINIELLINYLKNNNIRVIWTLHDCWPFTGQCSHFERIKCDKWKKQCYDCPLISSYPKSFIDNSTWNYYKKMQLFNGLDMTIVTPSIWLSKLVKQSFLKEYDVKVINNGIDTSIFKPTKSNFREKYKLENKRIILGVSNVWTRAKGYDDFIELSRLLDDDYKIVMVGLNDKQLKELPNNIIGIKRTESQQELVELYSSADIFFNPTYEDNYPTVNLEAIACGTPVITYNTGGSPEIASNYGYVTCKEEFFENFANFFGANIEKKKMYFSVNKMCSNYINLYKKHKEFK